MPYESRLRLFSQEEFDRVWHEGTNTQAAGRPDPKWFDEVGNVLSRRLLDDDIHLVRTGTVQLFQRRHDTLLEEVALRLSPAKSGAASLHVYLSHRGLSDVRMRYWKLDSRAPQVVAEGNLGQLENPPCWSLWPSGTEPAELADYVEQYALPWFEAFHEPVELHGLLRTNAMPLVREDTAVELVLAEYGKSQAASFLKHMIATRESLGRQVRENLLGLIRNPGPLGFGTDVPHNLAVIAYSYGLLKVRDV